MKNSKKLLLPLLMVPMMVLGMGSLSSCGVAFGSADTDDIDINVETKGVKLKFFVSFGNSVCQSFYNKESGTGILKDFENLTGIKVELEPKGGYDGLRKAINLSATNAKGLPSIANGYPDHFAGYIKSNIQLRLDGLIENDKDRDINEPGSWTDAYKKVHNTLPHFDYEDFYSDYVEENETLEFKKDGSGYILGIPFNKSTEEMAYNKTFFDFWGTETGEALLAKHNVGPIYVPETWDQLKEVGTNINTILAKIDVFEKILMSDGVVYAKNPQKEGLHQIFDATLFTDLDFRPFSYDSTENMFTTLVRQFGGTVTEVDTAHAGRGYVNYNSDAGRKAGALIKELWDMNILGVPANPYGEGQYCSAPFKGYKSLMNIGSSAGIWNNVQTNEEATFDVGIAPVLYTDAEHKYVISQGTSLGLFQLPANDPQRDAKIVAAWKLMIFLTQTRNGLFASQTGYFPACKTAAASQEYQDYLDNPLSSNQDIAKINAAKINETVYNAPDSTWIKFTDPGFGGSSEIRIQMGLIPGYLIDGVCATPQQAIDLTLKKLQDYIKPTTK